MFRRADRTTTERRQLLDSTTEDEEIETKIKECQRENGRCMVSTSKVIKDSANTGVIITASNIATRINFMKYPP